MKRALHRVAIWVFLGALLAVAGCTGPAREATGRGGIAATQATATGARLATQPPAATTAPARPTPAVTPAPTARPTVPPGFYVNPVLDRDFPDPDTLKVDRWYYAYATNGNGRNIQAARSQDLVTWEVLADALPRLPAWAVQDFGWAWAPEVWRPARGGAYVMYHVARFAIGKAGGAQCIGTATSARPEGPYRPVGDKPLVCQVSEGGSIDPATFVDDDGRAYLLWKNDGNSGGGQTFLYIQPLAPDGLSLTGEPVRLLTADKAWEGVLVEAPTLWKHADRYYLFYSANAFNTPRYATGYAVAHDLLGPYQKPADPLLKTTVAAGIVGPGGQDVVVGPQGDTWLLFHSWSAAGYRFMDLMRLTWQGDAPAVVGLSREPQAAPRWE